MRYLNIDNINEMGIIWNQTIDVIEDTVKCINKNDYAQPIKPYLRYRDFKNRIIAMPAFVGGDINIAGIKWIASFPDNINNNIQRAHSVVIMNDAETGAPVSIINTALLSIIRTASVSGLILRYYDKARTLGDFKLGIIGWGPIGQYHYKMCNELFGSRISQILLYDIRTINPKDYDVFKDDNRVVIVKSWEEVYDEADVFITCTVSKKPYINKKPKEGSLQLNVSLRDYMVDIYEYVKDSIIVDDWEEVCREKTDIENMHNEKGLTKEETKTIIDVVCYDCMKDFNKNDVVMFNPMGMAAFDIAISNYYYKKSIINNVGQQLV